MQILYYHSGPPQNPQDCGDVSVAKVLTGVKLLVCVNIPAQES